MITASICSPSFKTYSLSLLLSASRICGSGSTSTAVELGSIAPEALAVEDVSGLEPSEDADEDGLQGGDVVTGLAECERESETSGVPVLGLAVACSADGVTMSGSGDPDGGLGRALSAAWAGTCTGSMAVPACAGRKGRSLSMASGDTGQGRPRKRPPAATWEGGTLRTGRHRGSQTEACVAAGGEQGRAEKEDEAGCIRSKGKCILDQRAPMLFKVPRRSPVHRKTPPSPAACPALSPSSLTMIRGIRLLYYKTRAHSTIHIQALNR